MILDDEVYPIGTLTRTHGKSGELHMQTLNTAWEDNDAEFMLIKIDNILTPFRVTDWRTKGAEALIIRLDGVDSEEAALRLCGNAAYMRLEDKANNSEDSALRWTDLIGYRLTEYTDGPIGTIVDVDDTTANILLSIEREGHREPTLIPLHEDFITEIRRDERELVVSLPFRVDAAYSE